MKKIYSILAAVALMVPFAAGAQTLVFNPVSGEQGETVQMTAELNNPGMSIISFDCNILLPTGVTVTVVDDMPLVELTSRKVDHVVVSSILTSGAYKVVSYTNTNRAYKGESGAIFTMPLELNAEPGEYTVIVNNIVINDFATGSIVGHHAAEQSFTLTITEPQQNQEVDRHVANQFFAPDITIDKGENATLKLYYDSESEVYSFDCNVVLPTGVALENIAFKEAMSSLNFTLEQNWNSTTGTLSLTGSSQPKRGDTLPEGKNLLLTATLTSGALPAGDYTFTISTENLENFTDEYTSNYIVNFVVNGSSSSAIELTDGVSYTNDTDYDNVDVNYTRNFEHQEWQALYVPFNMSYAEWSDKADVARINAVHQFDRNGDGDYDDAGIDETIVEFVIVKSGELRPNTPYVIRPKQLGEVTFECTGKTLLAAPAQGGSVWCASTQRKYTLTGVYEPKTDMAGIYALRNGSFWMGKASSGALAPYRFYMTIENVDNGYGTPIAPAAAPAMMRLVVNGSEDTPTNIDAVMTAPADNVYYDLMGHRVENPAKGIYIVNGKKVVVK